MSTAASTSPAPGTRVPAGYRTDWALFGRAATGAPARPAAVGTVEAFLAGCPAAPATAARRVAAIGWPAAPGDPVCPRRGARWGSGGGASRSRPAGWPGSRPGTPRRCPRRRAARAPRWRRTSRVAVGVGVDSGGGEPADVAGRVVGAHGAQQRHPPAGVERGHDGPPPGPGARPAGGHLGPVGDGLDLAEVAGVVLGRPDGDVQPVAGMGPDVGGVQAGQLGPAERAGEAEDEEGGVPAAGHHPGPAGPRQAGQDRPQVGGDQRVPPRRRPAVLAPDPGQQLADVRVRSFAA